MKSVDVLLVELGQLDIHLQIEGDNLHINAPKGVLTSALRAELSARKAEIIDFLRLMEPASPSARPAIQPMPRAGSLPLSFAQQRLWFLDQLAPNNSSYNLYNIVRLKGSLEQSALQASLNEIVRRHESLRTSFQSVEGQPVQVIQPPHPAHMRTVDLCNLPLPEKASQLKRLVVEQVQQPFDLAQGSLLRVVLFRLDTLDHVLIVTMHHIISDAWSLDVFFRELETLYKAYASGQSVTLPELAIQYADYAHAQRKWLQGDVLQSQLNYWKRQLANLPKLELPTDRPRPATQTFRGAVQNGELGQSVTEALKALSLEQNATLFMTLLAAFQALLARHTGQQDISVGLPVAGRNWHETEKLIGFFLNTLVMRADLTGDPTFRELLNRVRGVALDAFAHQDLPFEKLVEELHPERDLSSTPLFQVLFNMVPLVKPVQLLGLSAEMHALDEPEAKFDLTLYVGEYNGQIKFNLVYNVDLFDAMTMQLMLSHLQTMLEAIAANPDLRLSAIPIFTQAERRRRSFASNRVRPALPFVEFPKHAIHQSIGARFQQQVQSHRHHVAVQTRQFTWTYEQLNERGNRIAQAIRTQCGESDVRLALVFEHDAPMIAGLLGTLLAGKTYIPLDPTYPEARLGYILQDSQASAILTNDLNLTFARSLNKSLPLINIDHLDSNRTSVPQVAVAPESPAYILYTSGSTGEPKGVVQNHRNVLHHIRNYTNNLHIRAQDRLTLLSSYSFDAAVMDIFGALLNGATLYPFDLKKEGLENFADYVHKHAITIYHSTPTVYRYWLNSLSASRQFPHVRLVVLGGEEVVRHDIEMYKKHFENECLFVNGLGPTESTLALQYFIDHETVIPRNSVPAGYPVEDTQVLLLDEARHETAVWGEIAIKSAHVALGYWQKPEATRAAFLPDSFDNDKRIYCTGDMGRLLPDGSIEFIGRKDLQVKVRGYRVELGEIEAAIARHPQIQQAVIVAHEFQAGDKRLVAYYTPKPNASPSVADLRATLKEKLPDYMIPALYVPMPSFPLTPTGKVDRKALPRPDESQLGTREYVAPRSSVEKRLTQIWEQVLTVRPIGIHDDFFDLGGHSLLGVRMFALINQSFGKHLPLATLFQASTIERLGQLLESTQAIPSSSSLVAIQPKGSKPPFYCVHEFDGNVLYYRDLALQLGTEHPFYGLQAQGLDGKTAPIAKFEEIAAHYVREIRTFQPQGPYFLGGSSLGGMVAFEMAQQLHAQGQRVALLALFDTWSPGYLKLLQLPLTHVASRHVGALSKLDFWNKVAYLRDRTLARLNPSKWLAGKIYAVRRRIQLTACRVYERLGRPLPKSLVGFYVGETLVRARRNYTPKPYPGRVTFFLAEEHPQTYYHDPGLDRESLVAAGFTSPKDVETVWQQVYPQGWGGLAQGGLNIVRVPGSHAYIVREPHAKFLAEKLRQIIDEEMARAQQTIRP